MSSGSREYSQLDPRTKYFIALTDISGVAINAGYTIGALMTEAEFSAATSLQPFAQVTTGGLLLDLGRSVTIYDPVTSAHKQLWRAVQLVSGVGTEGVSGSYANGFNSFYIMTWSETGFAHRVARTG